MEVSGPIPSQIVSLTRNDIGQWLNSYSFKPNADNFARVVGILQEQWFDKYQKNGIVDIEYLGAITQAPLRRDFFPMEKIDDPIAVPSPLTISVQQRPGPSARIFQSQKQEY